jgi:hypothetical protein
VLGGLLILLSFASVVLGIYGAIYLDRRAAPPPQQIVQQPPPPQAEPMIAPSAPPSAAPTESPHDDGDTIPPDTARALDAIEPTAGPDHETRTPPAAAGPAATPEALTASTPEPGGDATAGKTSQRAPIVSRSPSEPVPTPARKMPVFRVNYATYGADHRVYAERLAKSLSALGIPAAVAETSGRDGKPMITVWSPAADQAEAQEAAGDARRRLRLHPIVRERAAPPPVAAVPQASAGATAPGYSLQIAAFDRSAPAKRLQQRLAAYRIATVIAEGQRPDGRRLVLLRAPDLPDRAGAHRLAVRVQRIIHARPTLVGHREPRLPRPNTASLD